MSQRGPECLSFRNPGARIACSAAARHAPVQSAPADRAMHCFFGPRGYCTPSMDPKIREPFRAPGFSAAYRQFRLLCTLLLLRRCSCHYKAAKPGAQGSRFCGRIDGVQYPRGPKCLLHRVPGARITLRLPFRPTRSASGSPAACRRGPACRCSWRGSSG